MNDFSVEEDILISIADNFGTPSYVFDIDELERRMNLIHDILGDDIKVLYAMKANPFLVNAMKKLGAGFEVCSPGEFAICEKENVNMQDIVLSGVNKERKDIEYVMKQCGGAGVYTVESVGQFGLLASLAESQKTQIRVLLRVTSGNQFGLDEADIERIISERDEYGYVDIIGIQCYSGTQKKKQDSIMKEIDRLDDFCDTLFDKYSFKVREFEYGPGLPVSYFEPDAGNDGYEMLTLLASKLNTIKDKYSVTLEMGRYIAATCGLFLTRIADMKINKDQKYCIVDGGINHINYYGQTMAMKIPVIRHIPMAHSEEGCSFGQETVSNKALKAHWQDLLKEAEGEQQWNICGSLCTVGDVIVKNLKLENAKPGDMLVFYNIGAYSVTEGIYLFLSRNLPNIIEYSKDKGARLVRGQKPTYVINSRDDV